MAQLRWQKPAYGSERWQCVKAGKSGRTLAKAELGYAVTDHVALGRTVTPGLAVITGTQDRQHGYVALSAGPRRARPS